MSWRDQGRRDAAARAARRASSRAPRARRPRPPRGRARPPARRGPPPAARAAAGGSARRRPCAARRARARARAAWPATAVSAERYDTRRNSRSSSSGSTQAENRPNAITNADHPQPGQPAGGQRLERDVEAPAEEVAAADQQRVALLVDERVDQRDQQRQRHRQPGGARAARRPRRRRCPRRPPPASTASEDQRVLEERAHQREARRRRRRWPRRGPCAAGWARPVDGTRLTFASSGSRSAPAGVAATAKASRRVAGSSALGRGVHALAAAAGHHPHQLVVARDAGRPRGPAPVPRVAHGAPALVEQLEAPLLAEAREHAAALRALLEHARRGSRARAPTGRPPRGSRSGCPSRRGSSRWRSRPPSRSTLLHASRTPRSASAHSTRTGRRLPSMPCTNGSGKAPTIARTSGVPRQLR